MIRRKPAVERKETVIRFRVNREQRRKFDALTDATGETYSELFRRQLEQIDEELIVEAADLTPEARKLLEQRGELVAKLAEINSKIIDRKLTNKFRAKRSA
jgi:hypothetical protein